MSTLSVVLCHGEFVPEAQLTVYTSVGCRTIIDLATLTNTSAAAVTVQVHLVKKGDAPLAVNKVAHDLSIAPGSTVAPVGLNGARLDVDGYVSVVSGAADAVTIRMQGRQVYGQ